MSQSRKNWARLGVNIDHVATLRQLRGTPYPSLLEAADIVVRSGGEQITVHLREDRRHIQPDDVIALRKRLTVPLNLEMAATDAMIKFARKHRPDWVCLVPEKRQEVTTEGGLELVKGKKRVSKAVQSLKSAGIRVSLFIEPSIAAVKISHELGADAVEFHTGRFCVATQVLKPSAASVKKAEKELERVRLASLQAIRLGVHAHAGHGIDYQNVRPLSALRDEKGQHLIEELNIGHAIVCRAALVGMESAVREMISAIAAP